MIISGVILGISAIVFSAVVIFLNSVNSDKTLIVYFTRAGNTNFSESVDAVSYASLRRNASGELAGNCEVLANTLKKATGADIFAITVKDKYPESYEETVSRASEEQSDNARPVLTSEVENIDKYEKIILIYPVWWSTMPMPVFTFLENYDLSGKEIYPVATHKGSFLGSSVKDIQQLCPDSEIHAGIPVSGGSVDLLAVVPIIIIAAVALIFAGTCVRHRFDVKTKGAYIGGSLIFAGAAAVLFSLIRVMI